jgi:hypothetical protein
MCVCVCVCVCVLCEACVCAPKVARAVYNVCVRVCSRVYVRVCTKTSCTCMFGTLAAMKHMDGRWLSGCVCVLACMHKELQRLWIGCWSLQFSTTLVTALACLGKSICPT